MTMPLALLLRRRLRSSASPLALFGFGEQGVWFDPSDVANLNWRRNLLTYTEQFDNAAWTFANGSATANSTTAPDGTQTAEKAVWNTTNGLHWVTQTLTTVASTVYTTSVYLKAAGNDRANIMVVLGGPSFVSIGVNLTTGAITTNTAGTTQASVSSIESVGNGWYRVTMQFTANSTSTSLRITGSSASSWSFAGNDVDGLFVWGAQAELGSTVTDYQRITDVNTEVIERFPTATLYQDIIGSIPVTTTGQSVAIMLDKSKGLTLGSELVPSQDLSSASWVSGGAFGNYAGSTATSDTITTTGTSGGRRYRFACVPGQTFKMSCIASMIGTATAALLSFSFGNSSAVLIQEGAAASTTSTTGAALSIVAIAPASSAFCEVIIRANGSSGSQARFTNISVKELPGNHAVQATTANRPIYGIHPVGGRRNLLVRSEEFTVSPWLTEETTVTSNFSIAPDGTATAERLLETTATAVHAFSQTVSTVTAAQHVFSIYLKKGVGATAPDWVQLTFGGASTGYQNFNLSTGVIGVGSTATGAISNVGSGWYRCSVIVSVASAGAASVQIVFTNNTDSASRRPSYAGATTADVLVWGAQLETGSTATAYQRVTDQYNVTEAGIPSVSYLFFDGVNDSLATPSINFTSTDKMTVFAGVRKLSDSPAGVLVESSVNLNLNVGSFAFYAGDAGGRLWSWVSSGSLASPIGLNIAAPDTAVLSGIGNISADVSTIRRNGVAATSTADQGTGNFIAYPLYIGARAGSSLFFSGHLYSLIVRGAQSNTGQISSTETWVASKTGITI